MYNDNPIILTNRLLILQHWIMLDEYICISEEDGPTLVKISNIKVKSNLESGMKNDLSWEISNKESPLRSAQVKDDRKIIILH